MSADPSTNLQASAPEIAREAADPEATLEVAPSSIGDPAPRFVRLPYPWREEDEDYILLSGDPSRGDGLVTAKVANKTGLELRSWYPLPPSLGGRGDYMSDPESGIFLDEEEVRALFPVMRGLIEQLDRSARDRSK